jgi:two-component system cell cycle sensor histidine kinase/response regulator CckA
MTPPPLRVLLVEDDAAYAGLIEAELRDSSIELSTVGTLAASRAALAARSFDAVLLDLDLPDSSGVQTVARMHETDATMPVVVLTSNGDEGLSALSMQHGAEDYLLKSEVDARILVKAIRYARERMLFRRSMLAREARFRALVENSHDAVTLLDEKGAVLYDSRSIVRVMGYTPEERLGQTVGLNVHPEDRPAVADRLRYCLAHPDEILRLEYRFRHRDGSWRWGEAVGVNRLADPSVHAIVVNHRDVTERKTMEAALRNSEEQLRQAQKMEAVGRLAGGVAHDFNNVLTAIFGYTDLLLDQVPAGDPRRTDIEEIRKAAERAAGLTRQLLAFSRKQVMQPRLIDLNDVIEGLRPLLDRLIGEDIQFEIGGERRLSSVRADPGQVEQVLMNLVANARDAMPEGGRLVVSTRNEDLPEESADRPGLRAGSYVVFDVADTGTGMSDEVQARLFEPFYTTKELGKGTGLGLATVYGIMKQMGGGIYVESQAGQGTTFTVHPPPAAEGAPATSSL